MDVAGKDTAFAGTAVADTLTLDEVTGVIDKDAGTVEEVIGVIERDAVGTVDEVTGPIERETRTVDELLGSDTGTLDKGTD